MKPTNRLPQKLYSKKVAESQALVHDYATSTNLFILNNLTANTLGLLDEISGHLQVRRFTLSRNYGKKFSHS
jgi:hypothetical protein